ncbi:hypothetical protein NX081_11095 [Bacillus velezensis]|uniref:hypothetical protein n=1 Tax=Bacillus velezensis TaxID=492670 RepID=UPI0021762107|nr:hypothetical protein [Bacillus velezensis]UWD95645.1 hypothetical protein NX081_11095 [Bacillus velezensis]
MARRCVCQICKANGTVDTFFRVSDDKGKNKYYCTKDEYETYINDKVKRKNLLNYIAKDVLNYREGQVIPPIFLKKIAELNRFYDYEVIQICFEKNQQTIQYWLTNKEFYNEYGMISYIFKIVESNINDVYKEWLHEQNQRMIEKNHHLDIAIVNQTNIVDSTSLKQNNSPKNITEFLDGEDEY